MPKQLADPDRYRPDHCPQCQAKHPLTAHGFYTRTLIDAAFDGVIRVRRYLCQACQRTVSLLPEFALPYLRSSITVIALFLVARLLHGANSAARRRGRAAADALPARPVLDPPLSRASRSAVRRAGRVDHARSPRPTSSTAPCTCSNPPAGSPLTASCSPTCAATCWAGRACLAPDGRRAALRPPAPPA